MTELSLRNSGIRSGRWEAVLQGPADAAPRIEILHREEPLGEVSVRAAGAGKWTVAAPIPPALLSDGVQTFLVRDADSAVTIGHFTIVTGVPLEGDLLAEIDLLRAELDMLKKAFRRHCLETGA
jgi:hypothetical protein